MLCTSLHMTQRQADDRQTDRWTDRHIFSKENLTTATLKFHYSSKEYGKVNKK